MDLTPDIQPQDGSSLKQLLWLLLLLPLFLSPLSAWYLLSHLPAATAGAPVAVTNLRTFSVTLILIALSGLLNVVALIAYAIRAAHTPAIEQDKRVFWIMMIIFFFSFMAPSFWYLHIWHPERPKHLAYPIIGTALLYIAVYSIFGLSVYQLLKRDTQLQRDQQRQIQEAQSYAHLIDASHNAWQLGDYNGGVQDAKEALSHAKGDQQQAVAYYWLGVNYYKLQNFDEAGRDAGLATQLNPNYAPPHVTLGAVAVANNDYATARAEAAKAIAIDPKYAWDYNLLGIIDFNTGHKPAAIADEQQAIKLDSSQAAFQQNLSAFEGKY